MQTIRSVAFRDETILRYGGNGDGWPVTWAADNRQYASLCDGAGFLEPPTEMYNSRMLALSGGPYGASFHDLTGYPRLARPSQREDDPRYYGFATLALGNTLYQFLSTFNRAPLPGEAEELRILGETLRFTGVKLIYSPDSGSTWHNQNGSTPVVWESWSQRSHETMLFFEETQEAFSILSVLQMGRGYRENRDGYIYVYAPNGNTERTMNELVMFRVKTEELLNRGAYDYFAGFDSGGRAKWLRDIDARRPVHTFPIGWVGKFLHPYSWRPSVAYNAPLGLYLMVNWGTATSPSGDAWFTKPSYLGVWVSRNPWGPWTQVHEETAWTPQGDRNARCFQPQIAPKWIAPDGKSFWLVWSDLQITTDGSAVTSFLQERKRSGYGAYTEKDVIQLVRAQCRDIPYYSFNIQRVDLATA